MRRLGALLVVPLLIGGCGGADEVESDPAIGRILSEWPAPGPQGLSIHVVDLVALERSFGLTPNPEDYDSYFNRVSELVGGFYPPSLLSGGPTGPDAWLEEAGVSDVEATSVAFIDQGPEYGVAVFLGSFDRGDVIEAMTSHETWGEFAEISGTEDATVVSFGAPDPARRTPLRPIGRGGSALVREDMVVWGVVSENGLSEIGAPDISALDDDMTAVLNAVLLEETFSVSIGVGDMGLRRTPAGSLTNFLSELGPERIGHVGVGHSASGDSLVISLAVLYAADPAPETTEAVRALFTAAESAGGLGLEEILFVVEGRLLSIRVGPSEG